MCSQEIRTMAGEMDAAAGMAAMSEQFKTMGAEIYLEQGVAQA